MRLTALGHAGLKVETGGATVLVDPWLSPEGAFQASWFPYPRNDHLVEPGLFRPTAVVLSHEHLDHLDPWFLRRVPSSVPVVAPRYPSAALRRKVEAAGPREVVEAPPWEPVDVGGGATVVFVSEESPMNHDSAVVVLAGGRALLDLNDARLSPLQLRGIRDLAGGTVDLLALQATGASWYPICYRYGPERMRELCGRKRAAKLAHALSTVRVVEPVAVLPFAGPACFLDPELFRHNAQIEDGVFPDPLQVAGWLRARGVEGVIVLGPGDAWDLEARALEAHPEGRLPTSGERWAYLEDYARRRRPVVEAVLARYPEPSGSLWEPFRDHFRRLLGLSPYFTARVGMRVGFDVTGPGGGRWAVDFRSGREGVDPEMGECQYVFSFASRWLAPVLEGRVAWEDFLLSLRVECERHPDLYNDHLLGLLKFAEPRALEAVEAFESSMDGGERITVRAEGRRYSVARRCPHAGNDLEAMGTVMPGRVLRCNAHHYEFSLDDGRCLNGLGVSLDVERLD